MCPCIYVSMCIPMYICMHVCFSGQPEARVRKHKWFLSMMGVRNSGCGRIVGRGSNARYTHDGAVSQT